MKFLNTRPKKIAAVIGSILAVAGVAFAALLFTTTISGQTAFSDSTAGARIVKVDAGGNGGVTCTARANGGEDAAAKAVLSVSPTVKRINEKVQPGTCTVIATVQNTGTEPVKFGQFTATVPAGWTFDYKGDGPATIPPGQSAAYSAIMQATTDATVGAIRGELTFATQD